MGIREAEHGDIVENVAQSGYRSSGVYMVSCQDGKFEIVELDTDFDDYGGVPGLFRVISEFPCNYWHRDFMHVHAHEPGAHSVFYWHGEEPLIALGSSSFCECGQDINTCHEGADVCVEFTLGGQKFKISGAHTLDEVRGAGAVYGTKRPNELTMDC